MPRWPSALVACAIFPLAAHLFAQDTQDALCTSVQKISVPAAMPPADSTRLGCNFLDLYYKAGALNLGRARYCALQTRTEKNMADRNTDDPGDNVDNLMANAVLAMIYANGKGVAPDLRLAEHFACQMIDWSTDGSSVAREFEEARTHGAQIVDYDICRTPLERQSNYVCITRNQEVVAREIVRTQRRFDTGSPQLHASFKRLLAARDTYLSAHDAEEPNGNTGSVQAALQDGIDIDRAWIKSLNDLAAGKLPHYTAADFRSADASLNMAYRQAIPNTAGCEKSDIQICLTTDALRQIERAWIAYRDAWVAYAALRWPAVSADSWKTWLTLQQIDDLNNRAI